jgi:hypothetical protein
MNLHQLLMIYVEVVSRHRRNDHHCPAALVTAAIGVTARLLDSACQIVSPKDKKGDS